MRIENSFHNWNRFSRKTIDKILVSCPLTYIQIHLFRQFWCRSILMVMKRELKKPYVDNVDEKIIYSTESYKIICDALLLCFTAPSVDHALRGFNNYATIVRLSTNCFTKFYSVHCSYRIYSFQLVLMESIELNNRYILILQRP